MATRVGEHHRRRDIQQVAPGVQQVPGGPTTIEGLSLLRSYPPVRPRSGQGWHDKLCEARFDRRRVEDQR